MHSKVRGVLFVAALIAALYAPTFFYIPLALSLLRFRSYEMVFLALYVDILWYPGLPQLPLVTLSALVLFVVFEPLRRRFL
jgi:hypothetical protein